MHLYVITRGIKFYVDEFIKQLQGKYLPMKIHGKDGLIQVAVRPIQLWEIVYPKEHNDLMMTTIFGDNTGAKGITHQKKHRPIVAMIRKALGIKKLPKYDDAQFLPIMRQNMECVGVGVKDDYNFEDGTQAL